MEKRKSMHLLRLEELLAESIKRVNEKTAAYAALYKPYSKAMNEKNIALNQYRLTVDLLNSNLVAEGFPAVEKEM